MLENTLSISKFRAKLSEIIKLISQLHQTFTITQKGEPKAVVVNIEEYKGWLETLEIIADKKLRKGLKMAEEDIKKKRLYSHKEVFGKKL